MIFVVALQKPFYVDFCFNMYVKIIIINIIIIIGFFFHIICMRIILFENSTKCKLINKKYVWCRFYFYFLISNWYVYIRFLKQATRGTKKIMIAGSQINLRVLDVYCYFGYSFNSKKQIGIILILNISNWK